MGVESEHVREGKEGHSTERIIVDRMVDVEMDEEEEEESSMGPSTNGGMESGMRMEEMDNPSWLCIFSLEDQIVVAFSCLYTDCVWKGDEEAELAVHLQTHVPSCSLCIEGGEGGMRESPHNLFVPCPVPFCDRAFSIHSTSSIVSHLSMHAHHASLQKKGFMALISKDEFANVKSCGKKARLMSAHSGDVHVCMWDDCDLSFFDINEFFSHVLSHMEFLLDTRCLWDSCTYKSKHKSRLVAHVHHHMGLKAGACPFCGEVFSSLSKLYDHVSRGMEDETAWNNSVVCKLCRKAFSNEKSLRAHVKRHIARVRCDECGVLFSSKYDLNRHCDALHSDVRPQLVCSVLNCTATFTSNAKLMQHLKRHSEGTITCPHCTLEFRWMKQLTKHLNLEHSEEGLPQYVCHVCNGHYEEGSSLTRHLKKKHGVAIPPGFPRFQYKKCEDGLFRLQTNRPCS